MPIRDESVNQKVSEALKPDRGKTRSKAKPHTETTAEAQKATGGALAAISAANQAGLGSVASHIERVKGDRSEAITKIAAVIAYLHDPQVMEAEIFQLAATMIQGGTAGEYSNPYADFDVQAPCLPSVTSAGYLPV